jgi:hypothetical protein
VYLGLEGPTPRGRLASLFCTGAADPADALATTLRRARVGLADAPIGAEVATVLGSDALAFRTAALEGDDERAVTYYRGPFLDGLTAGLGTDLEEWCFRTREDLAGLAVMAHLRLARAALASGSRSTCLKHATAALRHAPAGTLDASRVAALRRVLREADLLLPGLWSHAVGPGPIVRRHPRQHVTPVDGNTVAVLPAGRELGAPCWGAGHSGACLDARGDTFADRRACSAAHPQRLRARRRRRPARGQRT